MQLVVHSHTLFLLLSPYVRQSQHMSFSVSRYLFFRLSLSDSVSLCLRVGNYNEHKKLDYNGLLAACSVSNNPNPS